MPYLIPRSQTVTLDASGNGQVAFSIDNSNVRWVIDQTNVATDQANNATPIPAADTYLNQIAPQAWQGGTYSGNKDIGTGRVVLYPDNVYYVVWTGGIPGSHATAVIAGTFDPQGTPIADR